MFAIVSSETSEHQRSGATGQAKMERGAVGRLGEEVVEMFLVKRGYTILARNFRRPWGELDIVAKKKRKIHFVEVKSLLRDVSDETDEPVSSPRSSHVSDETARGKSLAYVRSGVKKDRFRAEDSVGPHKIKRLGRIIQTYLMGKHVSSETPWQFDVATVLIDVAGKRAKVNIIEDLML